jgi:hypothetical protein
MRDGFLGRNYEIRQNSTGEVIFSSAYPTAAPTCGQIDTLPFKPTIHLPLPVTGFDGQPKPMGAESVLRDIFDPIKGTCTNFQFEVQLRGVPAGSYSLLIDGIEQTRIDGGPLFTITNDSSYDLGFYNIGVRPTQEDLGIGGRHPSSFTVDGLGEPISYSRRLQEGFDVPELIGVQEVIRPGPKGNPIELVPLGSHVADAGAFKVPSLRNVALTAPYFHAGNQGNLAQVLNFYNRGGDFHEANRPDLASGIGRLGLTMAEQNAVVAFLETLTDERVLQEQAPFDHPSLPLPGAREIEAVGSGGRSAECLPVLRSLDDRLSRSPEGVIA